MNKSNGKFHSIASTKWVEDQRAKFFEAFCGYEEDRLYAIMGYLNNACYFPTIAALSFPMDEQEQIEVDRPTLLKAIAASQDGRIAVTMTNLWQRKYLADHWPKAANSGGAIRRVRSLLRDLGLFEFDEVQPGSTYVPPALQKFDLLRSLIAYEACEKVFLDRGYLLVDDDFLPDHKGVTMVALFNAAFLGVAQFGRKNNGLDENVEVVEPIEPTVTLDQPDLGINYRPRVLTIDFWKGLYVDYVAKQRKKKLEKFLVARPKRSSLIPPDKIALVPY